MALPLTTVQYVWMYMQLLLHGLLLVLLQKTLNWWVYIGFGALWGDLIPLLLAIHESIPLCSRVNVLAVQCSTVIQSEVLHAKLFRWSFSGTDTHRKLGHRTWRLRSINSVISVCSSRFTALGFLGVPAHRRVAESSRMGMFIDYHCDSPIKQLTSCCYL